MLKSAKYIYIVGSAPPVLYSRFLTNSQHIKLVLKIYSICICNQTGSSRYGVCVCINVCTNVLALSVRIYCDRIQRSP